MRVERSVGGLTVVAIGAFAAGSCRTLEPQPSTYFDRTIAPGLQTSCVRSNTGAGCHVADAKGNAFGNLDLSGFDGVNRRRDLLLDYGPYLQPSLLVKNIAPFQVTVELWDGTKIPLTTDIRHAGGAILDPTGGDYQTLRRWIDNGATENNTGVAPVNIATTPCSDTVPSAPGFDPTTDPATADYPVFVQIAEPVLSTPTADNSCASGNCHGTAVNALYLTCGANAAELRWNYFAAVNYLAATAEQSEIVRRPLATGQGGSYHEGGPIFSSVMDPGYKSLVQWAQMHGPPQPTTLDPAFLFFARRVQPVLVKKGCMMAQCHSAAMFHDYRLRGGTAGSFSLTTTQRNYTFSVGQMSFESDDVNASRLVQKNLYRPDLLDGSTGITHRGGPLFEDFGSGGSDASPGQLAAPDRAALCDAHVPAYDYDNGSIDSIPAYCIVREWHRRERAERQLVSLSAIVYVSRPIPTGPDRPQDFDVFAGGASLHIVSASLASGVQLGTDRAIDMTSCGLGASPDVRRPAVSWDAGTIAFAARATPTDPLAIYTMNADGTGCARQPDIAKHLASATSLPNGDSILQHDFDPAFSPPGPDGVERIVFASTRGNLDPSPFDYSGPQRTPSDPTKPNANLYVLEPDPSGSGSLSVRQLTWQLDMERFSSFMDDGRLVFTAEKREPGFYQLALRRQNLDGGDYHPLFAQRGSIGYSQATDVVQLSDKNFAAIFSNVTAVHGAGALAVFNRSLGLDFTSQNPSDYPVDPSVIVPTSASSPEPDFFLHSLGAPFTDGSYTSPAALPDGQMLVSYGPGDPATFGGDYDVYTMDPVTGAKTKLLGVAGTAEVDAVAVYPRVSKGIFVSRPDEPNGDTSIQPGETTADVTVLDMPVLASLLFQNTPTGRLIETDLHSFDVYEELPPDVTSFPACGGNTVCDSVGPAGMVYVRGRRIGTVPIEADGSSHFVVPGGLPIVIHLPDDAESTRMGLPRWQREAMTFVPGEHARQSLPRTFFDHLCAGCHGAISGRPVDASLNPDFLTAASQVLAAGSPATDCAEIAGARGPVQGPPSSP
jgi:hypothetical protein